MKQSNSERYLRLTDREKAGVIGSIMILAAEAADTDEEAYMILQGRVRDLAHLLLCLDLTYTGLDELPREEFEGFIEVVREGQERMQFEMSMRGGE